MGTTEMFHVFYYHVNHISYFTVGELPPYFKYSVDKDLKMEDSNSVSLMVSERIFFHSSVCICLHFFKTTTLFSDIL